MIGIVDSIFAGLFEDEIHRHLWVIINLEKTHHGISNVWLVGRV